MQSLKDIQGKNDIDQLIRAFYETAMKDPLIGKFFTEVVKLDLEEHLPKIVDFWDSTLFQSSAYSGNPIQVHLALHRKHPIEKPHFDRWLELFHSTIDQYYLGNTAELAKQRATSIATIMQIKLSSHET